MKLPWCSATAKFAVLGCTLGSVAASCVGNPTFAQELRQPGVGIEHSAPSQATRPTEIFLPYAQFQIPFNISPTGPEPAFVQLWVSTDHGASWQMHGSAEPKAKHFEFRAAAEGLYLFSVHTVDASGASFPSNSAPLRVRIDTTKPQSAIRADVNGTGELVVDLRVADENLDPNSAVLRIRTDRDATWKDVPVSNLQMVGGYYESQAIVNLAPCREVAVVFSIKDQANNPGEATFTLSMPRTASGEQDMMFASTGNQTRAEVPPSSASPTVKSNHQVAVSKLPSIAGATPWEPAQPAPQPAQMASPGRLVGTEGVQLPSVESIEELPLPTPEAEQSQLPFVNRIDNSDSRPGADLPEERPGIPSNDLDLSDTASSIGQAYHCKSLAFSLDYSVEGSGGSAVADVELWGTEDGGRSWQMWGSDPDRQTPFDVRVGNEGLFGFRMVIVGANGIVSNRPKDGDNADVWINIDTISPAAKITRAVYGEGSESGMLVIDYTCDDTHLVDRPITLSFSERQEGPWTTIATGLKNSGMYLWKTDPNLPDRVYLKLEVVDKAGNLGMHRLDLPIDIKGLAPRGRIQGFRPISISGQ